MKDRQIIKHAIETAWNGAFECEESILNPWKGCLKSMYDADRKAALWREAFIDECHEICIMSAEDAANEAYHS